MNSQVETIRFSFNAGVTGHVYKNPELIYVSNDAAKDTKYDSEIDNVPAARDVRNFMIGAVTRKKRPLVIL